MTVIKARWVGLSRWGRVLLPRLPSLPTEEGGRKKEPQLQGCKMGRILGACTLLCQVVLVLLDWLTVLSVEGIGWPCGLLIMQLSRLG